MENFGRYFTLYNIIALILGIVGLVWLIQTMKKNNKIKEIRSWPKVNATVINAVAEPLNRGQGSPFIDPQYLIPKKGDNSQYRPIVVYRYKAGGNEYQSNNVVFAERKSYNAFETKTLLAQLSAGGNVQVYYNPKNNKESYIYNGIEDNKGIIWGIVLILLALALVYFGSKKHDTIKIGSYEIRNPNLTEIDESIRRDVTALRDSLQRTGSNMAARARTIGRTNPTTVATLGRMDFF